MTDTKANTPVISFAKNGPITIKHVSNFKNSRGEAIETKPSMALCRCGASKNKPFCDGTHLAIGFTDEKSDERVPDRLDTYAGKEVTILDNRGTCSHAGYCTSGLPEVWRSGIEPWIAADGAPRDDIINTIRTCPSGALSYKEGDAAVTKFFGVQEIQISRDGPYLIRGGADLTDTKQGEGASQEHMTLCRCGHSRNKPFCDGSHWYAGFKDDEALTTAGAARAGDASAEGWVDIGSATRFDVGKLHALEVQERQVVLIKSAEGWHALDGRCPHQGGPLGEGALCDGALRCPWHGYDFDIKTGHGVNNEDAVATYEVREQDGRIEVALPQPTRSSWTISHVIAETLVEWGVDTVFGMVGHSNLGMAEAIRVQEEKGKLRFFGIRHEGAAAFACSGYAKVSGKPAACLAIAGPGATNLLTGLWDARIDRAPVLALTGQVNTQVMGPGSFQEIDLASAFDAVSQFSQTVLPDSNHAELANLAMKNAIIQRDVSHLILPDEVQVIDAGDAGPGRPDGRISQTDISPPPQVLEFALYRIARAQRPLIIVGYGAREGMPDVIQLAETLKCPVITTFKAKGQISDDHPLAGGVLGKSGTPIASHFMNQSDLLIVFGASFAQHTGIDKRKPIIQVDFDRMALGKFHPVDELVWGDIGITAGLLRDRLSADVACQDQKAEIAVKREGWLKEKVNRETKDQGNGINSAIIFRHLSDTLPADAVISVDVGNNTYSFGRYFECRQQSIIMSGYLGSIGFAFPAAMGAWAAVGNKRRIISVSGDGGFGQYMNEFTTAVKYKMDIVHVLLNNSELGKISKEQRDGEWKVWQTSLQNPNFADYANLCGGTGMRVDNANGIAAAMDAALKTKGPSLVEIISDPLLT